MAERSFKKEVRKLRLGDGEEFHGEGILAVTKAYCSPGFRMWPGDHAHSERCHRVPAAMNTQPRAITVAILAMGGEGGGVLADCRQRAGAGADAGPG